MRFEAEAAAGNADGVFDAAYGFGEEAVLTGTPAEIGEAVTRLLASITPADCVAMRYGTADFYLQIMIRPVTTSTP